MAWIIIALLRFALVPYIVLLEPQTKVLAAFGRSSHLLQKGGQWFLVKGFFILLVAVLFLSAVTGQTPDELGDSRNIFVWVIDVALSLLALGMLYMLYRNRAAVRGARHA